MVPLCEEETVKRVWLRVRFPPLGDIQRVSLPAAEALVATTLTT